MKIKLIDGPYFEMPLTTSQEMNHINDPHNYTKEILEEWMSEPFRGIITADDKIVLDIGANVGLFAIHVLPYVDKIICVEPTPKHMVIQKTLLQKAVNAMQKEVIHEQSALNYYTGKAKFRLEPINTTMNTLSDRPDSFEVDCITLFDLCYKYGLPDVDLCKIDIEGGEFQAITVETVKPVSYIIKKFLLETHPRSRESQNHFKKIFEQCGYTVEYVDFNGSIKAYK